MTRFRPKLGELVTIIAPQVGCAVALLCVTLWAPSAYAHPAYDDDPSQTVGQGCVQCHTGFPGPGPLHQRHVQELDPTNCNLCHPGGGGSKPVLTYSSGTGGGLGCAGCHGQNYGEVSPNSGQPKATAYGLRLFHVSKGETSCGTGSCHAPGSLGHPNPFPTLFGEDVPPPYYNPSFSNLTDPCSSTQEDLTLDPDTVGLDNDGDGSVDGADSDCAVLGTATPTPTQTPTPTATVPFECGPAPALGCIAPEKGVLLVNEKTAGKEKLKVALKKLQTAVAPSQFGNPVSGSTAYKVCIYDATNQLSGEYAVARAGDICGGLSCWSTVPDKGYKYKDESTAADGILKINLSGGDPGKGKVLFVGKNNTSTMPTGIAAALKDQTGAPVQVATVQVRTSDASCFGVSLTQVKKADGALFKALGP